MGFALYWLCMAVPDSADGEEVEPEYPERWSWEEAARDLLQSTIELEKERLLDEVRQLQSKLREGERVTVEDVWDVKNEWLGLRYRLDVLEHAADREHPTDGPPPRTSNDYVGDMAEPREEESPNPDGLIDEPKREDNGELDLDPREMRIVGQTATVEETGAATVELRVDGELVSDFDAEGAYGLCWIPADE